MKYYHADVFSNGPFTGNGLAVFFADAFPEKEKMQVIAREMKQYETIFLVPQSHDRFAARIFTVEEELPFAGHPLLGATAAVSREYQQDTLPVKITFELANSNFVVECTPTPQKNEFLCSMNQGIIQYIGTVSQEKQKEFLQPLNLDEADLAGLPLAVLSAGLPYLYIPLRSGSLEKIKYLTEDYEDKLSAIGAKFAYPFDLCHLEGRSFDNRGISEDIATGSAAGPLLEYLCRHHLCQADTDITVHQGRFLDRPSQLTVRKLSNTGEITVSGQVTLLAKGEFL